MGLGKSQISDILNGKIRRPPDWGVITGLLDSVHQYALDHGRLDGMSLRTGVNEHWRPRYAVLEYAFRQTPRRVASAGQTVPPSGAANATSQVVEPVVPRQLPAPPTLFIGRARELAQLTDALDEQASSGHTVPILTIGGMGGIGKTWLALHWAHRYADRFPDGQLFVDLRGFSPAEEPPSPAGAVRGFLNALGVDPGRLPVELDAQVALYRSLVAGRRMLIVLDNARDSAQVRPLLPGTAGSLVLVTSRSHLTGLITTDGAHPLTLDLLTPTEASELLARRLGTARIAAEPEAVAEIVTRCARLPLALTIVAARAAAYPGQPLHQLGGELRDANRRLDTLTTDDPHTDVRAVFSWSYQALTADAARLFRLLGLHPGPDVSAAAVVSLAALGLPRVRTLLTELAQANLIVEHAPGRYTLHDLLRAYVVDLAHTHDGEELRDGAVRRMLDHYLHTACTAERLLEPTRDPITLAPPEPGVIPEQLTGHEQALAWFTTEHPVLLALLDHAAATGFDLHAWQLTWTLWTFLDRRGHWHKLIATQRAALAAAHRLADPAKQSHSYCHLAGAYIRVGRFDDAHTHLRQALELATRVGDQAGQAHTHYYMSYLCGREGGHAEALDHARQALRLFRAVGHRHGQAKALNAVGWYQAELGRHRQALDHCQQALTLFQQLGDRYGEAGTWDSLGFAHHNLGQYADALTSYRHAVALFRGFGDRYWEATILTRLGHTHQATGDDAAAQAAWRHAVAILDQLDRPDVDQLHAKLTALTDPAPASSTS